MRNKELEDYLTDLINRAGIHKTITRFIIRHILPVTIIKYISSVSQSYLSIRNPKGILKIHFILDCSNYLYSWDSGHVMVKGWRKNRSAEYFVEFIFFWLDSLKNVCSSFIRFRSSLCVKIVTINVIVAFILEFLQIRE